MIRNLFNWLVIMVLFGLTLFIIQGACFRLVESYAKTRLNLAWGNENSIGVNSFLSKLPLDHFTPVPDSDAFVDSWLEFKAENEYANKIMSFARPMRDRIYQFVDQKESPLRRYDIDNLGMVQEVVKPGLRRPANTSDVRLGAARREGMPVEYSEGLFVNIIKKSSRDEYELEFARFEKSFAFLLQLGIACCMLEVESDSELKAKLSYLQKQQTNFAAKLYLFAEGQAANLLSVALTSNEFRPSCVILQNPAQKIATSELNSAWFLGISRHHDAHKSILSSMIEQARMTRVSTFTYRSKLAGLLYLNSDNDLTPLCTFALAYLVTCHDFNKGLSGLVEESESLTDATIENLAEFNATSSDSSEELNALFALEKTSTTSDNNFDCEVVREYRQLHAEKLEMNDISNRDIVLTLGAGFEEMGEGVLLQIADRDPLFYRFYLSLREIQGNPRR
jgi:hypothetical protein